MGGLSDDTDLENAESELKVSDAGDVMCCFNRHI